MSVSRQQRVRRDLVERALEQVRNAGANAADVVLAESDSIEARVRGEEIDFVTQAREHTLGIRALVAGSAGFRSAITSTSSDRNLAASASRFATTPASIS